MNTILCNSLTLCLAGRKLDRRREEKKEIERKGIVMICLVRKKKRMEKD